ncbi:MAG: PLP-dependent aspartate aminotransferase family protein [Chloroflexota bacterium]
MSKNYRFTTNSIHAGESKTTSATPIHLGATTDAEYLRSGNPTLRAFEEKVCTLEGGETAVSTASGMAAISQTLLALLRPGDRLICHQTIYFWATELTHVVLPEFGIDVQIVDMRDTGQLKATLAPNKATNTVVYFEPLANPKAEILDAVTLIQLAKAAGATVVIDNTFLSPCLLNPLALGADIVLHSATKYLCGHGDALAGVMVTKEAWMGEKLRHARSTFGGILSPVNSYLLLRGIKTLALRVERHCQNAQAVAEYLDAHPAISDVQYPGLPSVQGHDIATEQWRGYGAMLNFEIPNPAAHQRFFERIDLIKPWVSLGDAGSLAVGGEHFGGPTRVRMSVGLEDIVDILADIGQALA